MTPLRSIARQVHLYAGLAAAPFLLVIGATGAFLEFSTRSTAGSIRV